MIIQFSCICHIRNLKAHPRIERIPGYVFVERLRNDLSSYLFLHSNSNHAWRIDKVLWLRAKF